MIDFVLRNLVELATLPGSVPKLRSFILDQAVRGNLTADWRRDHPEVEPASVLLERIREEKRELVQSGKIKKQKELPPVEPGEVPFQVPEGWEWVRLGDATQYTQYGTSAKSHKQGRVPVLRMGNIQPPSIDWQNLVFTSDTDEISKYRLNRGEVLFNRTNSRELVGKTAFFDGDRDAIFAGYLVRLAQPTDCSGRFMTTFLNSSTGRYQTQISRADGINQSNVSAGKLVQFHYPLAPSNEQTEIVRRVDELMALCDQLEAVQTRRDDTRRRALVSGAVQLTDDTTDQSFADIWPRFTARLPELVQHPDDIKPVQDAILQLAVRGHLTADWRRDHQDVEPASVLLERIREEKRELVKAGKIKKKKELPPVDPEDVPFAVPKGWEWVRLGELGAVVGGGTPKSSVVRYWDPPEIDWVTPADMGRDKRFIGSGRRQISRAGLSESSATLLPAGSVLFSSRAPIGYVRIASSPVATNQGVRSLVPSISELSNWVYWVLRAQRESIASRASGTTFPEVSGSELARTTIPLCPRDEQTEIVRRVDELMAICDNLRSNAETSGLRAERLIDTAFAVPETV